MEQTPGKNVTEMMLEPISGLYQEDYEVNVKVSDPHGDVDLLRAVLVLEGKEKDFFNDSAEKLPLPEVSKVFRKIVQRKEKALTKLNSVG